MPLMNVLISVCIPENILFSDLRLARDADGMVSFDWTTIAPHEGPGAASSRTVPLDAVVGGLGDGDGNATN